MESLANVAPTGDFAKPRRNVRMTPKYLTLLSTLRSSVTKLYANKRIRDIRHVNDKGSDQNSFRRAMSSFMLMAQCFALCPVQGITSLNAHDVRFTWCSWRVGYCIVMILGMTAACGFTIAFYIKGFFTFETSATVVLYTLGLSCCFCFMSLARRWPRLEELWQRTEHEQIQYGYPRNLYLRIRIMSAVTLAIALGEHFLAKYTVICTVALCSDKKRDLLQLYWLMNYRFVFEFVQFSLPLAFLCEIVNFFASFYWNFIDLFVIVLSMALSSRFRLLNSLLKFSVRKVQPETFWREARENYNSLSVLTKFLDSCISSIVLLSFATNMFYICQQLYNTLRKSVGTVKLVYFFVSISCLLFRTVAVSLCAASIQEESRATKDILYALPAESYTIEVHRFLVQISTDNVALTGLRFFTVNRNLLLTVSVKI
ncbi:gustatory receptor for sugar taste 64e isoform X2 [Cryptotermes secundus]|uniref:gustatory receptor for sugar taste 64e isoform X2 n=1 Tax=Cryptotermes secundus TaxID=105785 RepID=UPI001454D00A|nr:gustatory receptor for sugar taste 64e isoform X2 [Cryptotermes secundus]